MPDEIDSFLTDWKKQADPKALVDHYADQYGVPRDFAHRIVGQESKYNQNAVSPKGAQGVTQLMPNTAKGLGVNPQDKVENIEGGMRYLGDQLKTHNGDQRLAAASYNAGPGTVKKYGGVPPFKETQDYVKKTAEAPAGDDIDKFLSDWQSKQSPPQSTPKQPVQPRTPQQAARIERTRQMKAEIPQTDLQPGQTLQLGTNKVTQTAKTAQPDLSGQKNIQRKPTRSEALAQAEQELRQEGARSMMEQRAGLGAGGESTVGNIANKIQRYTLGAGGFLGNAASMVASVPRRVSGEDPGDIEAKLRGLTAYMQGAATPTEELSGLLSAGNVGNLAGMMATGQGPAALAGKIVPGVGIAAQVGRGLLSGAPTMAVATPAGATNREVGKNAAIGAITGTAGEVAGQALAGPAVRQAGRLPSAVAPIAGRAAVTTARGVPAGLAQAAQAYAMGERRPEELFKQAGMGLALSVPGSGAAYKQAQAGLHPNVTPEIASKTASIPSGKPAAAEPAGKFKSFGKETEGKGTMIADIVARETAPPPEVWGDKTKIELGQLTKKAVGGKLTEAETTRFGDLLKMRQSAGVVKRNAPPPAPEEAQAVKSVPPEPPVPETAPGTPITPKALPTEPPPIAPRPNLLPEQIRAANEAIGYPDVEPSPAMDVQQGTVVSTAVESARRAQRGEVTPTSPRITPEEAQQRIGQPAVEPPPEPIQQGQAFTKPVERAYTNEPQPPVERGLDRRQGERRTELPQIGRGLGENIAAPEAAQPEQAGMPQKAPSHQRRQFSHPELGDVVLAADQSGIPGGFSGKGKPLVRVIDADGNTHLTTPGEMQAMGKGTGGGTANAMNRAINAKNSSLALHVDKLPSVDALGNPITKPSERLRASVTEFTSKDSMKTVSDPEWLAWAKKNKIPESDLPGQLVGEQTRLVKPNTGEVQGRVSFNLHGKKAQGDVIGEPQGLKGKVRVRLDDGREVTIAAQDATPIERLGGGKINPTERGHGQMFNDLGEAASRAIDSAKRYVGEQAMKFTDFAKQMISDFGEKVRPHLVNLYAGAKRFAKSEAGTAPASPSGAARKMEPIPESFEPTKYVKAVYKKLDKMKASAEHRAKVEALGDDLVDAYQAGDGAKFNALQRRISYQLEGTNPITRIAKTVAKELPAAAKTALTTGDISYTGRQGLIGGLSSPTAAKRALQEGAKALSTKNYQELTSRLAGDEGAKFAQKMGLHLITQAKGRRHYDPTAMEDGYVSELLKEVPGIKHSEQFNAAFLDTLRLEKFNQHASKFRKLGITDEKAYKDMAEWVNDITGRGSGGATFEKTTPVLQHILLSPRFVKSRLNILNPVRWAKMHPEARRVAAQDLVKSAGAIAGVVGTAVTLGAAYGFRTTSDWDDPDFGKLVKGDKHYDVTASLAGTSRAFLRFSAGMVQMAKGEHPETSPADVALAFGRQKLGPVPAFFADWMTGTTLERDETLGKRKKFEMSNALNPTNHVLLAWKDIFKAAKKEGIIGALSASPSLAGIGFSQYESERGELTDKKSTLAKEFESRRVKLGRLGQLKEEPVTSYQARANTARQLTNEWGQKLVGAAQYQNAPEAIRQKALEILRDRLKEQSNAKRIQVHALRPSEILSDARRSVREEPKRERKAERTKIFVSPHQ